MPSRKTGLSYAAVCKLAAKLPSVEQSTSYGTQSLKVRKKLFARLKEDGETLVMKMDIVSRDLVLKAQPKIFYITDHYKDWPYVLVRLPAVNEAQMRDLLEDAWRLAAPPRLLAEYNQRGKTK